MRKRGKDSVSLEIDKFVQERKTLDEAFYELRGEFDSKSWQKPRHFSRLEELRLEAESIMEQYKLIEDDKVGEVESLVEEIVRRETVSRTHWEWQKKKRKKKKEKVLAITAASCLGLVSLTGIYLFSKRRGNFIDEIEDTHQMAETAYYSEDYHAAKKMNQEVLREVGVFSWGKEKEIKEEALMLKEEIDQSWKFAFWYNLANNLLFPYNQMNSLYGNFIPNQTASGVMAVTTLLAPVVYGAFRLRRKKDELE